jgi:hypothetical protein
MTDPPCRRHVTPHGAQKKVAGQEGKVFFFEKKNQKTSIC